MESPRRYLVTGGCGFIGAHLVRKLLAQGHQVRVLDNLSTGKREAIPAAVEFVCADVSDPRAIGRAMHGIDGCFHLAAVASVPRCSEAWLECHRSNLSGAISVMEAAQRRGVPVVYASSAAVYGNNSQVPLMESAACLPLSAYGADKLAGELHARAGATVHGLRSIGLRFFNVYGPGQDPRSPYSGVISIFAERLLAGEPIRIFGDGLQQRDFVYVDDVVGALQAAMTRLQAGANCPKADVLSEVFNVATGAGVTIWTLAETLAAAAGQPALIENAPRRAGDIAVSVGDPARIAFHLGWRASTPLQAGLEATLRHLAQRRKTRLAVAAANGADTDTLSNGNALHVRNHRSHRIEAGRPRSSGGASAA